MDKDTIINILQNANVEVDKLTNDIRNIVWEPQEGNMKEHFDNLPKAERIALIGILNESTHLIQSIRNYLHWFKD